MSVDADVYNIIHVAVLFLDLDLLPNVVRALSDSPGAPLITVILLICVKGGLLNDTST